MTKFICRECGYRISGEELKKCPYCNKGKLEKEKSAGELIEEVEKILG
jgi:rubrerythrin